MSENKNTPERKYPEIYEKLVPAAIGLIIIVIIGMLALTLGIALGLIHS